MLVTLVAGALLVSAPAQQTDTIVSVLPGARLDVESFRGEVLVQTWDRADVRIVADHSSRAYVDVSGSRSTVRLRARSRRGGPPSIDYELTIPRDMEIDIAGTFTDIVVDGVGGEVRARTVHGNIVVRGGTGLVRVESVQGDVRVDGARGRIEAESTNGNIEIDDVTGDVLAEGVNGEIILNGIRSQSVEAVTTNGSIHYDGVIEDDGQYRFINHNGNIVFAVPTNVNATVRVSTFNGEFEPAFPITLTETRSGGRSFSFTLGDGSARVELESFGGNIRMRRRGG